MEPTLGLVFKKPGYVSLNSDGGVEFRESKYDSRSSDGHRFIAGFKRDVDAPPVLLMGKPKHSATTIQPLDCE
jgi:hypothetical protein